MQVKKFEAKTMKEALDLVKVHLGPEAIILSAKDSHKGFGLMGEKSVEVTAAISDETLRKKTIAEAKLREDLRKQFHQIPAAKQREFIDKAFRNRTSDAAALEKREAVLAGMVSAPMTERQRAQVSGMRYIDIEDEELAGEHRNFAQERVRRAAERARQASREIMQAPAPAKIARPVAAPQPAPVVDQRDNEQVRALESQVRELKAVVERFQKMPQMPLTMHPGAEFGLPYEVSSVFERFTQQGVHPQLITGLLRKAQKELDAESIRKPAFIDAWLVRHLLSHIDICKNPTQGRYHVFMGTTGQGKTTTLVKFASHLVLKEKKTIAIVSMDTVKVGAADQLRIYAQILNVPFAIVRSPEEWRVAEQKLGHIQHILVDCPGFNLSGAGEAEWLKSMLPPTEYGRILHYVQSTIARDEDAMEIAGRYQALGFQDAIFTRLDESSRRGLMLNFQDRFKVPIHSFGLGTRIPEDFEFASSERVIDFIFKLTKLSKREVSR